MLGSKKLILKIPHPEKSGSGSEFNSLLLQAERAVSSYILLLAVLQLPAVRGQLIPVLQQLGDRFMGPLRLANSRHDFTNHKFCLKSLEQDNLVFKIVLFVRLNS